MRVSPLSRLAPRSPRARLAAALPAAALLAVALPVLGACGSAGGVHLFGDAGALRPGVAISEREHPPHVATVTLGAPAYAAVLYVVPGIGAAIVYPDSTSPNRLPAGQSTVTLGFPKTSLNRDSVLAAARQRQRTGRPTRSRDTLPGLGTGALATPNPLNVPIGHLLLVASPEPITYAQLKRRVEGITIPAEDDEALSTVVKLVRATLPERATWAAASREIELR